MEFWKWANKRAKNLNAMDIKLAEFAAICLGLMLAKVFPQLLGIRARWLTGGGFYYIFIMSICS